MTSAVINPSQILNSYRKSDAVIIVCQNNTRKIVEVAAINDEAARVIGFTNEDLVGKSLSTILPERLESTVAEFVEYEDDQNDLLAVLGKIRNFSVKTRENKELEYKLRVIRGEAIDRNPWFHLVLVDEEKLRKANAFREVLKENFKGHEVIDDHTGLPNRASLAKDLELVTYHVRNNEISACFAIIDINQYDKLHKEYGQDTCDHLHQHIGQICKQKLRAEDTVGSLSERSLGIILIDAPQEAARMVLNRLRWAISVTPMPLDGIKELLAQANVSFTPIDGKVSEVDVLGKCESFVARLRDQTQNAIQLVEAPARRERDEAVEVDRRKALRPDN